MISSISSFSRLLPAALLLAALLAGCGLRPSPEPPPAPAAEPGKTGLLAVLPFENLSASRAPLPELRQSLLVQLRSQGLELLAEDRLEDFMSRHRVRYTGGLDRATAQAFLRETGVGGVVITSLELYQEEDPPKIALTARLVGSGAEPTILWIDSASLAGNDAPGFLDLGLVREMPVLADRAMDQLAASLKRQLAGRGSVPGGDATFRPRVAYRAPDFDPGAGRTVAVLPFVNQSDRRNAGDILVLHFLRALWAAGEFRVIEPGAVREELMRFRVIMPQGASLDVADLLFAKLDAELLLSGKVLEYADYLGASGAPKVYFTVQVIERGSNEVVWSSQSSGAGDEGVWLFDLGKVNTASRLSSRMALEVVRELGEAP